MQQIFDWCVAFLHWFAPYVGMNYVEINIWLFIVIQPALIALFLYLWLRERYSWHTTSTKRNPVTIESLYI